MAWAATGPLAASVLAPYLTRVSVVEVYVDAATIPELESVAEKAGLKPIEGGRVVLRPFPTVATKNLATEEHGLCLAPWSRVYTDLRMVGVRGEEAAEHLRDVAWNPVEVTDYVYDDLSAEVTFTIYAKKYKQEVRVIQGRTLPTRSYWARHENKVKDQALRLLLNRHEELATDPQIFKAIVKMQKTLSDSSSRLSAAQTGSKTRSR